MALLSSSSSLFEEPDMRNAIGYFRSLNSINSWSGSLREEKHDWFLSERKGKKDQESAFRRRDNFGVNSVLKESRHRPAKRMQNEGGKRTRANRCSLLD